MAENEKSIAKQATVVLMIGVVAVILLVLDLLNRGLIWQALQSLRSSNNSTLPDEQRTIGNQASYQTEITFLS